MVQHNSACFKACPQPTNRSTVCWVDCLLESIVGNITTTSISTDTLRGIANLQNKAMTGPSGGMTMTGPSGGMTHDQLIEPFVRAFATTDPQKGGCPEVKVPGSPQWPSTYERVPWLHRWRFCWPSRVFGVNQDDNGRDVYSDKKILSRDGRKNPDVFFSVIFQ